MVAMPMMLLKATGEPRGNSSSSESTSATKMRAAAGLCSLGSTLEMMLDKGNPSSRAKANVMRPVTATLVEDRVVVVAAAGARGGANDIIVSTAGIK